MSIVRAEEAPSFVVADLTVIGLAAPSRGARETSVWRVHLAAGARGVAHSVNREEIFVALSGSAVVTLGEARTEIRAGDTVIVPAGQVFSLSNPGSEMFDAVAVAPVGVRATLSNGESFAPPWSV
jgi:mannose-6-phosphate isomerase-like protein (cupin superfamily)